MLARVFARGAIAAIVVAGLTSSSSAETLEFNFKSAADAKGWGAVSEIPWFVGRRGYRPEQWEGAYPVSLLKKPTFTDAEVTVEISDLRPGSQGGILIRAEVKDAAISGYLALLSNQDDTNGIVGIDRFTQVFLDGLGARDIKILCSEPVTLSGGRLSVIADGSKLQVLYNDEVKCTARDKRFEKGRVGLFTNYPRSPFPSFKSVVIDY